VPRKSFENVSAATRARMLRVGQKHTAPEMTVRRLLHRMGFRFRLHRNDLPGRPDLILPRHCTVIFVHGCFWHGHLECKRAKVPSNNATIWAEKLQRNRDRDARRVVDLRELGWRVLTVWECECADADMLRTRLMLDLADTRAGRGVQQAAGSRRPRR
jgi:DNA mismatch endonuclease, patch repair protein